MIMEEMSYDKIDSCSYKITKKSRNMIIKLVKICNKLLYDHICGKFL